MNAPSHCALPSAIKPRLEGEIKKKIYIYIHTSIMIFIITQGANYITHYTGGSDINTTDSNTKEIRY